MQNLVILSVCYILANKRIAYRTFYIAICEAYDRTLFGFYRTPFLRVFGTLSLIFILILILSPPALRCWKVDPYSRNTAWTQPLCCHNAVRTLPEHEVENNTCDVWISHKSLPRSWNQVWKKSAIDQDTSVVQSNNIVKWSDYEAWATPSPHVLINSVWY